MFGAMQHPDATPPGWVYCLPRLSEHAGGWLLDWFDVSGSCEAVTIPSREAVAWLNKNSDVVLEQQVLFIEWLDSLKNHK